MAKKTDKIQPKPPFQSTILEEVPTPIKKTKVPTIKQTPNLKPTIITGREKGFWDKIFSSLVGERREIGKYSEIVKKIESLDTKMQALSDEELRAKTVEFRALFKSVTGKEIQKKLLEIMPEAYAVVREAAWRAIGQKHYPVQLIGGIVLNDGRIAEMRTGEGKTLVSTLAAYLNALPEESQVHIVTVNEYLARRDASWMGEVFNFLGLSIGVIQNQASFFFKLGAQADAASEKKRELGRAETLEDGEQQDKGAVLDVKNLVPCDRKRAYWIEEEGRAVDIVYGVNSELGFDYLRDNMAQTPDEIVQKAGQCVAIIDEVDSILIDEARTPLIISSQDESSSARYKQFSKIAASLNPDLHYTVDEKRKSVNLTDLGIDKVQQILGLGNLYGSPDNVGLIHHLDQALKAHALFKREKEYVVRDNEIIIVDEFTGRLMVGRRYNQGLHQAIEAKESLNVQSESKTVATITFQNYFRLYKKLSGMTGTASTESEELFKIYKLLVVTIPTNRPNVRIDEVDKIFKTEEGKFKTLAQDIKVIHQTGQPILIGTTSIDKNLLLSKLLNDIGVSHEVLNAKNHEQEARIVSTAGRKGAVTLATNIAGRGVDIVLGGNKPENPDHKAVWQKEHEEVKALGGLYVFGTERHESRRIDNQLRGRSGRQGDPGHSIFYVSLQDYILRVFGGDRVNYYNRILPVADTEAIQFSTLGWLIEQAQKKIEGQNFDTRKYVTEYDDVINKQRSVVYARRRRVLLNEGFEWQKESNQALQRELLRALSPLKKPSNKQAKQEFEKNLEAAAKTLKGIVDMREFDIEALRIMLKDNNYNTAKLALKLHTKISEELEIKWDKYTDKEKSSMARFTFLRAIDILWTEHLVTIDHLQDSTRLRYIAQKDPLTEFKEEGMSLFLGLLSEIDHEIAQTVFKVNPDLVPAGMML